MPAGNEFSGFRERVPDPEQEGNYRAADPERYTPSPRGHCFGFEARYEDDAQQRRKDHGNLLAGRLPAYVEALAAGRCDFRKIDRDSSQFGTGGKSLQQTSGEH